MSDLQKSFAKARLAKLPPEVPVFDDTEETARMAESQDDDDGSSASSSASSTGTVRPSSSQSLSARSSGTCSPRSALAPIPWIQFFERELFIEQEVEGLQVVHHAYINSPSESGPLFVCHHGAGSSGLSFAACGAEIRKIIPTAGVLSIDTRGHGGSSQKESGNNTIQTDTARDSDTSVDLRLETLSRDLVHIVNRTKTEMNWDTLPPLVLVGHSLGGAVVTDVAKGGLLGSNVLAYAVLDVVEGSAMDALQSMETYLATRPTGFPSLASGIEWHTRSRTIRTTTSARVSVPPLLDEDPLDPTRPWKWHTDLAATKPFWENWFVGLSKKFLEARGGKLLLLAGTDRLDKELMIGQMQGKYQLQVFPEAGHFIHEDQPAKIAQVLVDFYKRNDRSTLVLPPKVGDRLAAKAMAKGAGDTGKDVQKKP